MAQKAFISKDKQIILRQQRRIDELNQSNRDLQNIVDSLVFNYVSKNDDHTLTSDDNYIDVIVPNKVMTLPGASLNPNKVFEISNSSGGSTIVVTTNKEKIYLPNGEYLTATINDGEVLKVASTGTKWRSL
ncbi:hypothetical protein AAU57_11940 [Nonlabens sp. YIK11]|uniref:hypothetical protein n=1 Tax=Nonlabens sp. YIK11 TaxID=1453349 RepID=UPI0006DC933B|nr:hypothetical protein [Nonlabens sp. YIK11]KQC33959.1 hypothetical protein AAU57_11940 [Nonlabens sp. YIK11]